MAINAETNVWNYYKTIMALVVSAKTSLHKGLAENNYDRYFYAIDLTYLTMYNYKAHGSGYDIVSIASYGAY